MGDKGYLDKVYGLDTPEETRDFYARWADSYDREVAANGYVTPRRCADALRRFADPTLPVLDFGCGTGLSGLALRAAGFDTLDGCDITPEMLEKARARGIYRHLWVGEPGSVDLSRGPYGAVVAIGVIGVGAAPVETFDMLAEALEPGCLFAFSFNDHTMEDSAYPGALARHLEAGTFEQLAAEYGPHLPGRDMNSWVYVLRRL